MKRIKIALVNISFNIKNNDPPLGLAYLVGYARKHVSFADFKIIDAKDPFREIRQYAPDIVGIGPLTGQYLESNDLAKKIKKEMGIPVIIGGHHISSLPQHLVSSYFDIAVIGEGEQTFLELLQTFYKRGSFDESELEQVDGIVFKTSDGKSKATKKRKFIRDLDQIPFPARDHLRMKGFYVSLRRSKFGEPGIYTHMMTSRGCPYKCAFCSPTLFWGPPRFHSPEYVVSEMRHLKDTYNVEGILIFDDLFLANFDRVKRISSLVVNQGLHKELRFGIFGRTNLINDEMLRVLVDMNVTSIDFGLESGSPKILGYLKKNSVTVQDNVRALELCKEYGLHTIGTLIVGSPDETEKDLEMTLDLVKNPNLDEAYVLPLAPLPGTAVWEYAKEKNIVSEAPDFSFELVTTHAMVKEETFLCNKISIETLKTWQSRMKEAAKNKNTSLDFSHFKLRHLPYLLSPHFIKKVIKNLYEVLYFLKNASIKG